MKISKNTPELLQIWFWDKSGFSLRVRRGKTWNKKERINVRGGLRYGDKKRWVEFIEKENTKIFYEAMKEFYKELINKWVDAGNHAKDFAEKGAKIIVILDNASIHKKEETRKKNRKRNAKYSVRVFAKI